MTTGYLGEQMAKAGNSKMTTLTDDGRSWPASQRAWRGGSALGDEVTDRVVDRVADRVADQVADGHLGLAVRARTTPTPKHQHQRREESARLNLADQL